jgi:hypothetical protein
VQRKGWPGSVARTVAEQTVHTGANAPGHVPASAGAAVRAAGVEEVAAADDGGGTEAAKQTYARSVEHHTVFVHDGSVIAEEEDWEAAAEEPAESDKKSEQNIHFLRAHSRVTRRRRKQRMDGEDEDETARAEDALFCPTSAPTPPVPPWLQMRTAAAEDVDADVDYRRVRRGGRGRDEPSRSTKRIE